MMKLLVTCFLTLLISMGVNAQDVKSVASENAPIAVSNQPVVLIDEMLGLKEAIYDFGKIPQGKPVTHVFDVVNNGMDSLKIVNVQASCGCTTPDWERDKVQAPGQATKIIVGYNAASEGSFSKFITITYNGTQSKQITIKGDVWKTPLSSAPENAGLKSLKEDK
jgi:hypothetical protein